MTGCAPAVNVDLPGSPSAPRLHPCNCTEMHPATREPERVYNESESSSDSRVDGSRFRLALSNDPPLSCHTLCPSRALSLSHYLSFQPLTSCSLPVHLSNLPSLVHPSSSTTAPIRAASGVTLNSGPATMCPTTRTDVDKARPIHEARRISRGTSRWRNHFAAASYEQLLVAYSREETCTSIITKITDI